MPHMNQAHILRLQQEYQDILPVANQLAQTIATELRCLLHHNSVCTAVPLEFRVKTWGSIEQKFVRANYDCCQLRFSGASLSDLTDLVGIRVIVLFTRDVERVLNMIEKTFTVIDAEDTAKRRAADQFGYSSMHYQVRVPDSWIVIPTFRAFRSFQAEIQVRTLAQHMWAAASHELQYKQEESVPDHMRRAIHRISSLLELVDTEYDRLLNERDQYRSQIQAEARDRTLNSDVLEAVLDKRLPRKNKRGYEPYSMLVWELRKLGITTAKRLEELIARRLPEAIEKERTIVGKGHARSTGANPDDGDVFFTHQGFLNIMLEGEYAVDFHSQIFEKVEAELSTEQDGDAQIDDSCTT